MITRNFFDDFVVEKVHTSSGAAATPDIETQSVDMSGFHGVAFVAVIGTIAANGTCKMILQHSDGSRASAGGKLTRGNPDATGSNAVWEDIDIPDDKDASGPAMSTETPDLGGDDDHTVLGSHIYSWVHNPKRYVRAKITRAGGAVSLGAVLSFKFADAHHAVIQPAAADTTASSATGQTMATRKTVVASGGRPAKVAGRG